MLIQAHCQQEREKRCTITANASELNSQKANESSVEKMDTDETADQPTDGIKTPKIEPNRSPTPNDVEMIDTTEPVTAIKQEPEDEVTSVEIDPLAEGDCDDVDGGGDDDNSTSAIKSDAKNDSQQSETKSIKMESNDNCNDCNNENSKDAPSESTTTTTAATITDEPIKIEESAADKDDPYSKDINIDPRTYCKLGHFHLLLEDYSKGTNEWNEKHC